MPCFKPVMWQSTLQVKGLHIKPNDLIGKTGLNSLGYYVNSTLKKKRSIWP